MTFDVGGVLLERPFKVRRLGHFGLNAVRMDECVRFYTEDLGFRISDTRDFAEHAENRAELAAFGDANGYFFRHGTDHHSFVIFNKRVREALQRGRTPKPGVLVNQISWQVGSLAEVDAGRAWLADGGTRIIRSGRDMPGANWHTYFPDPDGHTNELYALMDQIGWNARSKPRSMWERQFLEPPALPQISEDAEVRAAAQRGDDLAGGSARRDALAAAAYDVDGVLLPRPFKIVRIGPLSLFVADLDAAIRFYTADIGLRLSEVAMWNGRRCAFLRANTEHHSIALYPLELRAELGLREDSTTFSAGFQVGSYHQLRDARAFLAQRGATFVELPSELHPGIDYAYHVLDPDGQAVQLYFSMEQIGCDGRARPAERRPYPRPGDWPETVPGAEDTYGGETLLGPLG